MLQRRETGERQAPLSVGRNPTESGAEVVWDRSSEGRKYVWEGEREGGSTGGRKESEPGEQIDKREAAVYEKETARNAEERAGGW